MLGTRSRSNATMRCPRREFLQFAARLDYRLLGRKFRDGREMRIVHAMQAGGQNERRFVASEVKKPKRRPLAQTSEYIGCATPGIVGDTEFGRTSHHRVAAD